MTNKQEIMNTKTPWLWHTPFVLNCFAVLAQFAHVILYYLLTQLPVGYALRYGLFTIYKNSIVLGALGYFLVWAIAAYLLKNKKLLEILMYSWIPLGIVFLLEVLIPR
jgi:hypothetical protein